SIFVFSSLFSATSVMNFGEGESGSAVQAWMLLGFIWLLRLSSERVSTFSLSIDRRIFNQCAWLIAFLFFASISLIMPLYINGRLSISAPRLFDTSEVPLFFTMHHVTQLLYL